MERAVYRVREFCERNAMSPRQFYRLVKRGELWIVKSGRKTLIPIACERAWHERLALDHVPVHVSDRQSRVNVGAAKRETIAVALGRK